MASSRRPCTDGVARCQVRSPHSRPHDYCTSIDRRFENVSSCRMSSSSWLHDSGSRAFAGTEICVCVTIATFEPSAF